MFTEFMKMFTVSATQIRQSVAMEIQTHCFASGAGEAGGGFAFFAYYFQNLVKGLAGFIAKAAVV